MEGVHAPEPFCARAFRWITGGLAVHVVIIGTVGFTLASTLLFVAVAAGYACRLAGTPIPWMLGPLFALALLRVGGAHVDAPPGARYAGQWIIGTSLALYFMPAVVRQLAGSAALQRFAAPNAFGAARSRWPYL